MDIKRLFEKQVAEQCIIVKEDVDKLSPEEFTMLRRCGLGASDSSVILGLHGAWKTKDAIIAEKIIKDGVTDAEKDVALIVNVRKGRDLEPIIIKKASDALDTDLIKPTTMYALIKANYLTINYDGVGCIDNVNVIPIEAKFVSQYGDKYYDHNMALTRVDIANKIARGYIADPYKDTEAKAAMCGVPAYYYTQVQQQMLGLEAPYGILAALHDKDWTLRLYLIPRDNKVQADILLAGYQIWNKVLKCKQ